MAYFRCGGGGMPAGLQSSMDAVLNKKFGTSTTYPASGWPDNVNLLGPLPIIISNKAPIVSIKDGANDVPIAQGTFYVVPSQAGTGTPSPSNPRAISGYTGMTITKTGKNIADIVFSDYNTANIISSAFSLKAGTYTLSLAYSGTPTWGIYIRDGATISSTVLFSKYNDTKITFTLTEDKDTLCVTMYYANGITSSEVSDVMIETGSTATTYTAYTAPETLPVSWQTESGTVYGGELNVTTGVLTVTWGYIASYNGEAINEPWLSSIDAYVPNTSPSTGAQVAYTLATPTTYQLTPHELRTFYGANNFYCDTGDSQLNYRADISLYINNH